MKESEERMGIRERLDRGVKAVRGYSGVLKMRIESELAIRQDRSKTDRVIKKARERGIEGFDITPVQRGFIDSNDEASAILKNFNPKDVNSLDEFLESLDPSLNVTTESVAVLSRRIELGLDREGLTLEQIREAEQKARSLTIEMLRLLLK